MVRSVAANSTRPGLRSADTAQYQLPRCRTAIGKGRSRMLVLMHGTHYLRYFTTLLTLNSLENS
jgi:hypothetical protein